MGILKNNYNSLDNVERITLTKKYPLPSSIAFDVFEQGKIGYCVILFKPSIPGESIIVKDVCRIINYPKYHLYDFIAIHKGDPEWNLVIYEYSITCDGQPVVIDVTKRELSLSNSYQDIRSQLD